MKENSNEEPTISALPSLTNFGSSLSPGALCPPVRYNTEFDMSKLCLTAVDPNFHATIQFSGYNGPVLLVRPNGDVEFPQGNISEAAITFTNYVKKTWYSSDLSTEGRAILVARIRELEAEIEELKSERNRHGQNQEGSEAS